MNESRLSTMRWTVIVLGATIVLLLLADFLAFHDLFEPHTVKDWLILVASILAVVSFAGDAAGQLGANGNPG